MKEIKRETAKGNEVYMTCDGCRDIVVIDADYGKCKSITIEEGVDCLLAPRNPFTMESCLFIEYENGVVEEADTLLKEVLTLGQVHCYTADGQPGFLCNKQVVAAIGRAIANLNPFLEGKIEVPSEEEAEAIVKELSIPIPPLALIEAEKERPDIELEWLRKWKSSGKLCYMSDLGDYEIEKTIPKERRDKIQKSGESLVLESIGE